MTDSCPHCRRQVSPDAGECPGCGAPLREGSGVGSLMENRVRADVPLAIMVVLVVAFVWCGCDIIGPGGEPLEHIELRNETRDTVGITITIPYNPRTGEQDSTVIVRDGILPDTTGFAAVPNGYPGDLEVQAAWSSGRRTRRSVDGPAGPVLVVTLKEGEEIGIDRVSR